MSRRPHPPINRSGPGRPGAILFGGLEGRGEGVMAAATRNDDLVLVVEDDPASAEGLRSLLHACGYRVRVA
jgi:hypothetical protein